MICLPMNREFAEDDVYLNPVGYTLQFKQPVPKLDMQIAPKIK